MKNDKRLDDLLRKGLSEVDLPPPPTQDWAAMARAAKQGARTPANRDGGTTLTARWLKVLGAASAILAAWYFSPSQQPPHGEAPGSGTSEPPSVRAELMGGANAVLMDLIDDVRSDDGQAVAGNPAVEDGDASDTRPSSTSVEQAPTRAKATDDEGPAYRPEMLIDARSAYAAQDPEHVLTDPDPLFMSTGQHAGSAFATGPTFGAEANAHGADGHASLAHVDVERREGVLAMELLPLRACALPYTPKEPESDARTEKGFHAHWSIAPWFSLGRSTWTDPSGNHGALEQLSIGQEGAGGLGVRVQYAFDRRLAAIIGIQYARKGSLSGTVHSSPTLTTSYKLSGDYIELPLSLKFILPLENKELYARVGGLLQFNMHNGSDRVTMNDRGLKEMSTLVLAQGSLGTALDIGIGAQFRLSQRVGLFIEPSYQYSLSPVVKHPSFDKLPCNPRIHSFNLATGLSFQL